MVSVTPVSALTTSYGVGSKTPWSHFTNVLVPSTERRRVEADVSSTWEKSTLSISDVEKMAKLRVSYMAGVVSSIYIEPLNLDPVPTTKGVEVLLDF